MLTAEMVAPCKTLQFSQFCGILELSSQCWKRMLDRTNITYTPEQHVLSFQLMYSLLPLITLHSSTVLLFTLANTFFVTLLVVIVTPSNYSGERLCHSVTDFIQSRHHL